ncbi:MAG: hypothetical protein Q9194_001825, partial [Teloschistes cf. exilis]
RGEGVAVEWLIGRQDAGLWEGWEDWFWLGVCGDDIEDVFRWGRRRVSSSSDVSGAAICALAIWSILGCLGLRLKFSTARMEVSRKGVACVFAAGCDVARWTIVVKGAVEGAFTTAGTFAAFVTSTRILLSSGSFARFSFSNMAFLLTLRSSIALVWSACLAILDSATLFLVDSGFGLFSPASSTARPPLMKTAIGATPLRLTPVKLFVTTPSLSSLALVARPDKTEADDTQTVQRQGIAVLRTSKLQIVMRCRNPRVMDPYYYYCEMTAYEYPRPRPREALNSLAAGGGVLGPGNLARLQAWDSGLSRQKRTSTPLHSSNFLEPARPVLYCTGTRNNNYPSPLALPCIGRKGFMHQSKSTVPNIIRTANAAHLHLFCDPFRTPTRHARLFYIEADSSFNAENPITPGSNIA